MMKKISSLFLAILMLISVNCTAFASEADVRASHYLDAYYVTLTAKGNGRMSVLANVEGVGTQDKIGVLSIDIQEKVNGNWCSYDTLYGMDHPEFYEYNSWDYFNTIYFEGTPGSIYRVVLTVYAEKNGGCDTGFVTSFEEVCT